MSCYSNFEILAKIPSRITTAVAFSAPNNADSQLSVEPPVSDHQKCDDVVVACGRWSFTRFEPQKVFSE